MVGWKPQGFPYRGVTSQIKFSRALFLRAMDKPYLLIAHFSTRPSSPTHHSHHFLIERGANSPSAGTDRLRLQSLLFLPSSVNYSRQLVRAPEHFRVVDNLY
jgi:hypothetical protein